MLNFKEYLMNHFCRQIGLCVLFSVFCGTLTFAQVFNLKMLKTQLNALQKELVPDKRVAICDVLLCDTLQPVLTLKGRTDQPEAKTKISQLFQKYGVPFVDSIKFLPAASLEDKNWGLIALSVVGMRAHPAHAAEMVSQALMGTPVKILDSSDNWYLIQTPDMYLGWVEEHGVQRLNSSEIEKWKQSNRCVFIQIVGNIYESANAKGAVVSDLVLDNILEIESEVKSFYKVRIPDGRIGFVRKKDCLLWSEWINRKPCAKSVIEIAKHLLGEPYVWGGTSTKGVDCSGLLKTSYYSQGVILARDASQQARYGQHPDFTDFRNQEPGDLLFFGRNAQHVTHVGLYMENGRYIHSSGLVRINSLDPNDSKFNLALKKSLVASSRVFNSFNTDGITLVKDHPWYSIINK